MRLLQSSGGQIVAEEGPDFFPTVDCLGLAVAGPVIVEEAVAGAIVHVEFVVLAVALEGFLVNCDVINGWAVIFGAEQGS